MDHPGASRPSLAIIGAGWAGLSCALTLARAGVNPVIFESAPEPGGRARRAHVHAHWRDNGQHLMLGGCRTLMRMLDSIGVILPTTPFVYTDGQRTLCLRHRRGSLGLLVALTKAGGFTWRERYSLVRTLVGLQWCHWQTPTGQTVAQWLAATRQPPGLIRTFWEPLALAIMNTPLNQASMARLASVLRDTLGAGAEALALVEPRADLSDSIVFPLVRAIEHAGGQLRYGSRITAIAPTRDGYHLCSARSDNRNDPDIELFFDQVIVTVPPWALGRINLPFDTASLAERFGEQPIATVYLGFDADVRLPTPLIQLAEPTPTDARIWAMDRTHCGEPGVIAVSLSAEGGWTALDADTLAQRCLTNLQSATGLNQSCRWHKVVTVRRATPTSAPMAALHPNESQPLPGLYLAGDWTHPEYPATLEAAVQSGISVANQILDRVRITS